MELMCRILQTVIETVTRCTIFHFRFKCLFQFTRGNFRYTGRENNALAFLYIHFEISGNIQVFVEVITTFLFLRILNATIPVRLVVKLIFLIQLHEELGIAGIHTSFYTIFYQLVVAVCLWIFVRIFAHTTKRQERAETKCGCRMGIYQGITNQNSVFVVYKDLFFAENNSAYTVSCRRDMFAIKFADILMSIRTKVVSLIFMQPQVKLRTVLNYRFIQRRQQHMIFIVEIGDGNHQ